MGEFSGTYETFDSLTVDDDGRLGFLAAKPMGDQPGFDGYLVPFYSLADRGCYFVPGSLKKTAKEQLASAQVLYQHFSDVPIGKFTAAVEDDKGFRVSAAINEGTQAGADVMSNLRFGVPMGLSIGFDTISDRSGTEADDKLLDRKTAPDYLKNVPINELRAITAARWWEGSVVTWPAIANAKPDQVRSANGPGLSMAGRISTLLASLKAGTLSQEDLALIEQLVAAHRERAAAGTDHGTPDALRTDGSIALLNLAMTEVTQLLEVAA